MAKSLDLYLISTQGGRSVLFSASDAFANIESQSTDWVRQLIEWLSRWQTRIFSWIGWGVRSLYDYYTRLEDKIDPVERVFKVMAFADRYVIYVCDREA